MLLDQKRTRRMVQIVSVIAAVAFAGVIFVVLGVILFGGGGSNGTTDLLKQAQQRVQQEPRNPAAWEDLASRFASNGRLAEAIPPAERAVQLAPNDYTRLQTLISLLSQTNDHDRAVAVLQKFTARNASNADAFILLGLQAEQAQKPALARLAYGRFLELLPNDVRAADVRAKLKSLNGSTGTTSAPATPATPAAPATPATP